MAAVIILALFKFNMLLVRTQKAWNLNFKLNSKWWWWNELLSFAKLTGCTMRRVAICMHIVLLHNNNNNNNNNNTNTNNDNNNN